MSRIYFWWVRWDIQQTTLFLSHRTRRPRTKESKAWHWRDWGWELQIARSATAAEREPTSFKTWCWWVHHERRKRWSARECGWLGIMNNRWSNPKTDVPISCHKRIWERPSTKIQLSTTLLFVHIFYFRNSNVIEKNRYTAVFRLFLIKRKDWLFYQNNQSYLAEREGFGRTLDAVWSEPVKNVRRTFFLHRLCSNPFKCQNKKPCKKAWLFILWKKLYFDRISLRGAICI